jgi:hypothetical protein
MVHALIATGPIAAHVTRANARSAAEGQPNHVKTMKKTTRSTYKKDKYYKKVTAAVHELLKDGFVVVPAEVLIQMRYLTKEDYENWRFGRIPYLERVIGCNLSKVNRILRILRLHAADLGLRPSPTGYKKWGKGPKIFLRFSRSGAPWMEILYSTHYVARSVRSKVSAGSAGAEQFGLARSELGMTPAERRA